MRKLLISMSITYMLVDCFYNLLLPSMLVLIALKHDVDDPNTKQWRESMQLVSDVRVQFVLAFNLQMVYFYYKLALPSTGSNPDVIEATGFETTAVEKSVDPSIEPTARLSEQSRESFARFMEAEQTDAKLRE